ncbi:LAME_0B00672g1_1 [Lachancea meyersii CBS 8951]|uniref:LAME_0B00672g1_1 n=1 Tax=Lachancea meyersii CBS 8951 TaxID=1266667 RepID=A0A1G4ISH4_9SACH|nr:LAME_0B00672g1_1 [Lachancea meyersii CBS 8951]
MVNSTQHPMLIYSSNATVTSPHNMSTSGTSGVADVTSLDQDLQELRRNKFSPNAIEEISNWIFRTVLGESSEPPNAAQLLSSLKDGTVLCRLANKISSADDAGNYVPIKFKASKMPFVQMEQISQFLSFAREYGVPEDELFQTVDLFEEKDPASVFQTLKSLSRYANKKHSHEFPVLGPQLATKKPQPPKAPKPKSLQGIGWSSMEYGSLKGASQSTEGVVFGQRRDITR